MSTALVLKSADFSVNSIEQIVVEEPIPCTGISLNKSTISVNDVDVTETLVATVSPSDCTQTVIWTTSNADVATVNNGVVTFVGLGTATITATCGIYHDTCTVTVDDVKISTGFHFVFLSNTDGKDYVSENHPKYNFIALCDEVPLNTPRLRFSPSAASPGEYMTPHVMPKGVNQVHIYAKTGLYSTYTCYVFFCNSEESATNYPLLAKMVQKTNYNQSNQIISVTEDVPDGADSIALFVRVATAYTDGYDADLAASEHDFTVTFSAQS